MPVLGVGNRVFLWKQTKERNKRNGGIKNRNKEGLGPSEGGPLGHLTWPLNPPKKQKQKSKPRKQTNRKLISRVKGQVRWPFGPPHLTLKPSKKNKTGKKTKSNKNAKKVVFQLSVHFFFFSRVSKTSLFLTTWPKKRAPQHTIKIGVSATHFLKTVVSFTKPPFLDQKTQNQKFQLSVFVCLFFSFNNKKRKNALKPLFYSVFASKPKKRQFQKLTLKHRNSNKQKRCLYPFLRKNIFRVRKTV